MPPWMLPLDWTSRRQPFFPPMALVMSSFCLVAVTSACAFADESNPFGDDNYSLGNRQKDDIDALGDRDTPSTTVPEDGPRPLNPAPPAEAAKPAQPALPPLPPRAPEPNVPEDPWSRRADPDYNVPPASREDR